MELSSLIGKQILSPAGDDLGYAKSAFLTRDRKKLSCLVCIDGEEEEFYLPARAVLAAGDVIIAGKARLPAPTGIPCPIGLAAYSSEGERLGTVADYLIGDVDPLYVVVQNGVRETFAHDCVSVGESAIVYPDAVKKRTAARKTNGEPRAERPTHVQEPTLAREPNAPAKEEAASSAQPQGEVIFNRYNLLGRLVKKSVFDGLGYPIVNAGERVTAEIISRAHRQNRLLQLTVNTLTNIY